MVRRIPAVSFEVECLLLSGCAGVVPLPTHTETPAQGTDQTESRRKFRNSRTNNQRRGLGQAATGQLWDKWCSPLSCTLLQFEQGRICSSVWLHQLLGWRITSLEDLECATGIRRTRFAAAILRFWRQHSSHQTFAIASQNATYIRERLFPAARVIGSQVIGE